MNHVAIRPVRPEDVPAVVSMVHELHEYERAPEQCHLTAAQLHAAQNPAAGFYAAIGAAAMADWVPYRLAGDPLRRLAEVAPAGPAPRNVR